MSTATSRPRVRKSPQQRSEEIYAAATALAREGGLSALTLRAVATRAGVASGLVAHYASSMDELVARTFHDLVGAELAEVCAEIAAEPGAAARLARMIATVLRRDHNDITLVWVDAWSLGRSNEALATAIEEQMAAWQDAITEIILVGESEGAFRVDDAAAVAWQLLAMIDGIAAHALTRGTDAALFATRLAQASETLVGAEPDTVRRHLAAP
ncbi:TetR/AcrR family transcriptional regulator [Gulosibacter chungangensis]|uniref:TetR family transcriptional regulator n=1 Tax=Gulosibacter chungangensis TaxID=979746 RepID=A0A7J5B9Y3_9MICO|nr:TetR family transcriptional regulator C-terminal domain-containing protein [Gulosibacter chungangensis]KAB1640932.1 TetR family transcriptional regulator [Gulosibacter chungangensis]